MATNQNGPHDRIVQRDSDGFPIDVIMYPPAGWAELFERIDDDPSAPTMPEYPPWDDDPYVNGSGVRRNGGMA